jgi:DNA-binding beta-propeller fold protein YncE
LALILKLKKFQFAWIGLLLMNVSMAQAVRPVSQFQDLVAGRGELGFQDGSFTDAQFANPTGLALDEENHRLFVADKDNHRIRLINLDDRNRVETLAGTGQIGKLDGSFSVATFSQPCLVIQVADGNLVIYDRDYKLFRLLDLKKREVSTLIPKDPTPFDLTDVYTMAYSSSNNCLYYTQPASGTLSKLNLSTLKTTVLLNRDSHLPSPTALCLDSSNIYVADTGQTMVYSFPITQAIETSPLANLQEVGPATQVIAMTFSGGSLYALQTASPYLVCLRPARVVALYSVWGDTIQSTQKELRSFFVNRPGETVGFIGGGKDEKRGSSPKRVGSLEVFSEVG